MSSTPGTFAANCLLARRLAEQGVKFIQLYHQGWDQHDNLPRNIRRQCEETDQASAALVTDLKQRGMLDDTLVVWGGEFGRTSYSQGKLTATDYGRDHHPRCFTVWMAGGGVKAGLVHGATDDFSYNITEGGVHVHDFQATLLHLLGVDHERLTYLHQGRRFRLTDVHGEVVKALLAYRTCEARSAGAEGWKTGRRSGREREVAMVRSTPARVAGWLMIVWLVTAGTAGAQVSTATIQGTVTDSTGVLPGATVTAREIQSGFTNEATTAGDGTFTLAGLRPGRYEITVAVSQYKPEAKTVEVLVGQTVSLDFRITPDLVYAEAVTVVGDTRLLDTRKSEVTTNVTAGADAAPAAEQPQLPQLRGARARAPRLGQRVPQGVLGRRAALAERQRLHRRRQLQERRHRRRRRRPGLEPRQPVPAERGAGVPGPDPELQGRVREGRERHHHRRSPRAAATGSRASSSASTRTRASWRTRPSSATRRASS